MADRRYALINRAASGEVNDLSATVTWANVPDANITESSVTQHEAALTITESQISDLTHTSALEGTAILSGGPVTDGYVLTADGAGGAAWEAATSSTEVNDLTAAVTWANVPDANITESSVTQHEAALDHDALTNFVAAEHLDWTQDQGASNLHVNNITSVPESAVTAHEAALTVLESQITDSTILARVGSSETITGSWTFDANVVIDNGNGLTVYDSTTTDTMALTHDGTGGRITLTNANYLAILGGVGLQVYDATGADYLHIAHDGTDVNISGTNTTDINLTGITTLQAGTVDADFDAITATSYGGITEANLVDKSAAENIGPNTWTFDIGAGGSAIDLDCTTSWTSGTLNTPAIRWQEADGTAVAAVRGVVDSSDVKHLQLGTGWLDTYLDLSSDGVAATGDLSTTGDLSVTGTSKSLRLKERSADTTTDAGYGRIWVLDEAPSELWFTDDNGSTHHVAGGSLSEVFGTEKAADETVSNSTTLQDDDHLSLDLKNGFTYLVKIWLRPYETNIIGSTGFKWDFSIPTSSTGDYRYSHWSGNGDTSPTQKFITDWTADQSISSIDSTANTIEIDGIIRAGSAGTFKLRWACAVASATDDTILQKYSTMSIIEAT